MVQNIEEAKPKPELLLANLNNELDSADLYRYLAQREPDKQRAGIMLEMAEAEMRHAAVMEQGLQRQGVKLPKKHRLSGRTRLLKLLARWFGPRVVYPLL